MSKTYEMTLDNTSNDEGTSVQEYEHDDGYFVGDSPRTEKEIQVLALCKGLSRLISPLGKLKIILEEIE